jgi:hypothetical protein
LDAIHRRLRGAEGSAKLAHRGSFQTDVDGPDSDQASRRVGVVGPAAVFVLDSKLFRAELRPDDRGPDLAQRPERQPA